MHEVLVQLSSRRAGQAAPAETTAMHCDSTRNISGSAPDDISQRERSGLLFGGEGPYLKGEAAMAIRILIVDDHSVVREGLRMFLQRDPELALVGEASDGAEAVELVRQLRPDVVLMDLLMPVMDGIAATAAIRSALPETEVIALTSVVESAAVVGAVKAGAIGYLLKDTRAPELRRAIKAAAAGLVQLAPQASAYLAREVQAPAMMDPLTERETEVLRLLAQGQSNKEIARSLQIVEDTVKVHVKHILAKLGVQSRTQAALCATRLGLVSIA
jgi:two-component system, NarL family, response regulator LiaR